MEPTTLILAATAGLAGMALVESAIRRSVVGVALVAALVIIDMGLDLAGQVAVGGLNMMLRDAVAGILLLAAVARLLRAERVSGAQWALIALGVLVLISVIRGLPDHGTGTLIQSRRYMGFVPIALYFSTIEPRSDLFDRVGRVLLILAGTLAVLTLLRWGGLILGISGGIFGSRTDMRVFGAEIAVLLVQGCAIAALGWWATRSRRLGLISLAFIPFIILLQHRTAWVAAVVGLMIVLVREPRIAPRATLALAVVGTLAVASFFLFFEDRTPEGLGGDITVAVESRATFDWRVEGWRDLLAQSRDNEIEDRLLGQPFGTSWGREVAGRRVTSSPHNFYLEVYLRLGLLGIGTIIVLYVWAIRHLRRRPEPRGGLLPDGTLLVLIGIQLTYFITYANEYQAIFLGLAIAASAARAAPPGAKFVGPVETSGPAIPRTVGAPNE